MLMNVVCSLTISLRIRSSSRDSVFDEPNLNRSFFDKLPFFKDNPFFASLSFTLLLLRFLLLLILLLLLFISNFLDSGEPEASGTMFPFALLFPFSFSFASSILASFYFGCFSKRKWHLNMFVISFWQAFGIVAVWFISFCYLWVFYQPAEWWYFWQNVIFLCVLCQFWWIDKSTRQQWFFKINHFLLSKQKKKHVRNEQSEQ